MKVLKWLDEHFEEALLIILLALISCVELLQVICRNVPFIPALTWPEEFCRYCWIWSVFISLPYTVRKGNMLRVTVLLDAFPRGVRSAINVAVDIIIAATMLLLGVYSIEVVQNIQLSAETSPAMLWPMWIVYSIMLFGFFLSTVRSLQQAYLHIKNFRSEGLSTAEQTMAEVLEETEAVRRAEGGDK